MREEVDIQNKGKEWYKEEKGASESRGSGHECRWVRKSVSRTGALNCTDENTGAQQRRFAGAHGKNKWWKIQSSRRDLGRSA